MDPDAQAVTRVAETGADRVELYTEAFAKAYETGDDSVWRPVWQRYAEAAAAAGDAGLAVNAGHDLDRANIGHALTADALELGMAETVRRYVAICDAAR
jgi:pyridoxine 5-phosphate synthase